MAGKVDLVTNNFKLTTQNHATIYTYSVDFIENNGHEETKEESKGSGNGSSSAGGS